MILSIGRFGIAPIEQVKALDKHWAAYRKLGGLDLYGKPVAAAKSKPFSALMPASGRPPDG